MIVEGNITGRSSVLIVDDDVDIREVLAETLKEFGFEVMTAANGREALEAVREMAVRPSVIVLDLMMPIMDGYGFLEERSLDPTLAGIPVAIITAGRGVDRARIADGIPIVAKPFEAPRLIGVLQALTARGASPR